MTRSRQPNGIESKSLLSVDEAATLLGITRSTAYKAISDGTFPVRVIRLGGRLRIPRESVRRLLDGADCITDAGSASAPRDLTDPTTPLQYISRAEICPSCGSVRSTEADSTFSSREPMCSAARLSSSGTASV